MIAFHRHPLAALIALALAAPVVAQATDAAPTQADSNHGRVVQNGAIVPSRVPPSSEHVQTLQNDGARLGSDVSQAGNLSCVTDGVPMAPTSALPFVVSVDGAPANGQASHDADRQRCVDVTLAGDTVQVRYDPMVAKPMLNAWTATDGGVRGEPVRFRTWSNYAAWVARAEIRVFARGSSTQETPLAVVPVDIGGDAQWLPAPDAPADLTYVLRVADAKGRFDETRVKSLTLVDYRTHHDDLDTPEREALTGYGEDSRDVANIPVHGAAVTVNGHVPQAGTAVHAMNTDVPVGRDGKFAMQQILPPGDRVVDVTVGDRTYRRSVRLPERDWFYVGVIDITASHGSASANATVVDPSLRNEVKSSAVDGRLAFYSKGTFENGWKVTASADTREQPLYDLFSNFASKDPRYLLRRIDPDQYYPVYGDDSTAVDDAPTQGKFYVRVEKDDSQFTWGNFLTSWTGSELVQYSRGLYGANALWKSQDSTSLGERRTTLNAFAADPGTVASREEFRGTGGSLYYLQRQDITTGSERVWVEIRDRDSGLVLQRTLLVPGSDYDLNYLQGRVLLRSPLSSMADGSGLVQVGSLSGNPAYLVVNYEYVPGVTELDTFATGARGEHWFNDHVRIGATSYHQGGEGTDQNLGGIDATLRYKPGTFLRMEAARSKGEGTGTLNSIDGGFNFQNTTGLGNQPTVRSGDDKAYAGRVDAAVSLADFSETMRGTVGAYWQDRQSGFSAPGQITLGGEGARQVGAHAELPLGKSTDLNLKADRTDALSQDRNSAEAALKHQFDPHWSGSFGIRAEDRGVADATLIQSPTLSEHGKRTDAIVRVDYQSLLADQDKPSEPPATLDAWNAYGFVQQTLARSGTRSDNDRVGLGGGWQVTERIHANAEVSEGDGGLGGKLGGDYRISDRSNVYAQYLMETDRPDLAYRGRFGTLVGGAKTRLNDRVSVYEETRETTGSGQDSLIHAFGIDMTVNDRWTTGFKLEQGTVTDPLAGDLRRQAASVSLAYKGLITKWASSLEYRYEDSNNAGRRTSWLTRNTIGSQLTPAWRLLGKLDMARSGSSNGVFFDGNYTEGVLGAAYRPVDNDRWNTLFKYTYMYDLPSPGQLSPSGGIGGVSTDPSSNLYASTVADYSQKGQVLSVDTIYDVTRWLSLGAKFGYRWGSLKPTRTAGDWLDSTATLWVVRAEWKFVRNWSGLVEWRRLSAREAGDARQGALVGVYRYVTKHVKVGVGYNFTRFSDDMTNLNYNNRGVFLNVLSTF
ncbi:MULTISPECIES: OmpA family protein [Dyella]|uniref:OmpA family protein n=2 Tax=Dyella TaxID=231454 RepID=A0A4R0YU80_9GAMM|nr:MULTISPECIES: OmpA family protein [Dyella]TBR39451.1 OmpA family protein [Dyella terrae]TCI12963.1 OmpA family protein [Dyella soli]